MTVLQESTNNQDDGGEEDEEKGDDSHYPGAETEAGILEQIPPPLLGPAHAGVWEDVHVVLLPHARLLHLILPSVIQLLAAWLHKQFTDTPVGQLFTECNRTGLWRAEMTISLVTDHETPVY